MVCVCGVWVYITPPPYPIVREKAKALVSLLKDEERLKEERRRAHLARERQIALGSNNTASGSPKTTSRCVQCVCVQVSLYILYYYYIQSQVCRYCQITNRWVSVHCMLTLYIYKCVFFKFQPFGSYLSVYICLLCIGENIYLSEGDYIVLMKILMKLKR